ncbi:hypothetical protein F4780DRAFT_44913 [Xylariomycetidae sp. FL0641]|nr:hypothetical protein F4780DRAFT_44913 [Xylariomycetidae sp. FL0641]
MVSPSTASQCLGVLGSCSLERATASGWQVCHCIYPGVKCRDGYMVEGTTIPSRTWVQILLSRDHKIYSITRDVRRLGFPSRHRCIFLGSPASTTQSINFPRCPTANQTSFGRSCIVIGDLVYYIDYKQMLMLRTVHHSLARFFGQHLPTLPSRDARQPSTPRGSHYAQISAPKLRSQADARASVHVASWMSFPIRNRRVWKLTGHWIPAISW